MEGVKCDMKINITVKDVIDSMFPRFTIEEDDSIEGFAEIIMNGRIIRYNNSKLQSLLEQVPNEVSTVEFFKDHKYYEVLIKDDMGQMYRNDYNDKDEQNNVEYNISLSSAEYIWYVLFSMFKYASFSSKNIRDFRFYNIIRMRIQNIRHYRETDICETYDINSIFRLNSLKISTEEKWEDIKLKNLKEAFIFTSMYNNYRFTDWCDCSDIFVERIQRQNSDLEKFDIVPYRFYEEDTVKFYKIASETEDPFIEYISYYHIIEYYFDKIYSDFLIEEVKNTITKPSFSYKKDSEIEVLIKFIENKTKNIKANGAGNEIEYLKVVLEKCIDINELKSRVDVIFTNSANYYQVNKVSFSGAPKINWNDRDGINTILAKRIYKTRNSLVHSKSNYTSFYNPYKDIEELRKEIPLIRAISELIIINFSKAIQE